MNNMRSYSLAFYPQTKNKMEAIKNEKQMTWDELFNYFMESKNEEKATVQKERIKKALDIKEEE